MPTLEIDGVGRLEVDDSFTKLSPDQQNAFIADVVSKVRQGVKDGGLGKPDDQYAAAAKKEMADLRKMGAPVGDGYGRQVLQGLTFGAADEALAGLSTPFEMIKRGTFNPAEGYRYAKARENLLLDEARKKGGVLGTAAEIGGGVLTGGALAKAGMTLMPQAANAGLKARMAGAAGEGAIYGGVTGFNEGEGLDRLTGALKGAGIGGAVGGALPAVTAGLSAAGRNLAGFVSAKANPEGYAQRQIARALMEGNRTPQQIAQEVSEAAAVGQPFTLADALGNPGQRMLSTVARNPGVGRTNVVEFLDNRQGGQGQRIASILANAMDAPQPAGMARAAAEAKRGAVANKLYDQARKDAGAVDVSPVLKMIDDRLQPGVSKIMQPKTEIADDSIEAVLGRVKRMFTDGKSNLTDFNLILQRKKDIDNLIERAPSGLQRELIPVKNAIDDALASASKTYNAARLKFRNDSKAIEAIQTGENVAKRGRIETNRSLFDALTPREKRGFRQGYADPLIERAQRGAVGQNKAREFTSDVRRAEIPAFAARDGQGAMRAIERENTMFETRAAAMGGSKTADNLADNAALGVNPEIIGNILSGNFMTGARNLVSRSSDVLSGNTAPVRERLAEYLLQTGVNPGQVQNMVNQIIQNEETRRRLMRALASGALAGGGVGNQRMK